MMQIEYRSRNGTMTSSGALWADSELIDQRRTSALG